MTYGWAILIIAIVMAAMFSLGVFNPYTFSPKASPGSCQVLRSSGYTALVGTCTNQIPQSVANFNGGYINFTSFPDMPGPVTITAWVNPSTSPQWYRNIVATNCFRFELSGSGYPPNYGIDVEIASACGSGGYVLMSPSTVDRYSFITVVFSGTYLEAYDNGVAITGTYAASRNANVITHMHIGEDGISKIGGTDNMHGYISNVQIYNTSLSGADIQALYKEGIGGAPIDINNLAGWWPLNGNAKDYSGNNNDGNVIGKVIFTSKWYTGYTAP